MFGSCTYLSDIFYREIKIKADNAVGTGLVLSVMPNPDSDGWYILGVN